MLRCKKGDLAIIVSSPFPENLGAIVEVKEGPYKLGPSDAYWEITTTGRALKFAWLETGEIGYSLHCYSYDNQLKPIRPGEEDKEIVAQLNSFMPDFVPEPALYLD